MPTFIPKLTSKWLKKGTEEWQKLNHDYIQELEDGLNARNLMKRYKSVNFIFNQLFQALSKEQATYFTMNIRRSASSFYVSALYVVSMMGSLIFGTWMVFQDNISVGMLITIYMAADRVTSPLITLSNIYNTMIVTEPLLRKILNDTPMNSVPLKPIYTEDPSFLIKLESMSIGYNKENPILKNFDFEVKPGDKVLIEGASGSGKSTLLRTIMNEHEPLFRKVKVWKRTG